MADPQVVDRRAMGDVFAARGGVALGLGVDRCEAETGKRTYGKRWGAMVVCLSLILVYSVPAIMEILTPATEHDNVRPIRDPIKRESHLVVLRGNLAPEGAVAKISGKNS